jgi:protein-tyrosine phosphatase
MIELKSKNVRAVLSLQSRRDLRAFSIDPEQLKRLYEKHGIRAYNIEIMDMKLKDFVDRSQQAVRLLRQLVETYRTVYVHCTAGIYRSPQLVVLYLVQFEQFSVEQAVSFVKTRRPCAQPYLSKL